MLAGAAGKSSSSFYDSLGSSLFATSPVSRLSGLSSSRFDGEKRSTVPSCADREKEVRMRRGNGGTGKKEVEEGGTGKKRGRQKKKKNSMVNLAKKKGIGNADWGEGSLRGAKGTAGEIMEKRGRNRLGEKTITERLWKRAQGGKELTLRN